MWGLEPSIISLLPNIWGIAPLLSSHPHLWYCATIVLTWEWHCAYYIPSPANRSLSLSIPFPQNCSHSALSIPTQTISTSPLLSVLSATALPLPPPLHSFLKASISPSQRSCTLRLILLFSVLFSFLGHSYIYPLTPLHIFPYLHSSPTNFVYHSLHYPLSIHSLVPLLQLIILPSLVPWEFALAPITIFVTPSPMSMNHLYSKST